MRRNARVWQRPRGELGRCLIALSFAPGEACQFDWGHEVAG